MEPGCLNPLARIRCLLNEIKVWVQFDQIGGLNPLARIRCLLNDTGLVNKVETGRAS